MAKLSIIIPLYNSEEFIGNTLLSIINSNLPHKDYDIIVVNDGSTDKSVDIVNQISQSYQLPLIRIINQDNGGPSKARNTGISVSNSEYIWFFDSDDSAVKDLTGMIELMESYSDMDVYAFKCNVIKEGTAISGGWQPHVEHNKLLTGRDAILQGYMPGSIWTQIINRSFLLNNDLKFEIGITQQDVVFNYQMFAMAKKVYFSNTKIYNYHIREDSISKPVDVKRKTKYHTDKVEVIKQFYKLAEKFDNTDTELSYKIRTYADGALFGCVLHLFRERKELKPLGINKAVIDKLKDAELYPLRRPFNSWKKKLVSWWLNIESNLV